jgi:DNA-binding transcriptional LysR family regulator
MAGHSIDNCSVPKRTAKRNILKLSLEGLQILDAISRRGSFAAAAEELFRVPSTITYAVQKLEEDLGVALFQRNGHRPRLTPAGEALLEEGRLLLQSAGDLEARVKHVAEGYEARLAIALDPVLPCAPLLDLLREFYADAQHAQTDVRIAHHAGALAEALVTHKADLILGVVAEGALNERRHRSRQVGTLESILAASPSHPLAALRTALPAHELRKHRIALVADAERCNAGQKSMALPTLHAKIAVMKAGAAAGFIARSIVARELAAGELVEIALERPAPRQNLFLAWDERPRGKAFLWWLERLERPNLVEDWVRRSSPRPPPISLVRQA